jgi:O-antigen ligase
VFAQLAVACYGLYQFVAGYAGLPQGLAYGGSLNGLHRISALSYEPAFYGAYVLTSVPLLLGDVVAGRRRVLLPPSVVAGTVVLAGVLANTRAAYVAFALIVPATWLVGYRGAGARRLLRRRALPVILPGLVAVVVATTLAGVRPLGFATRTLTSLTDTGGGSEGAGSNSSRLRLYRAVGRIAADHPLLGVGPRNLGFVEVDSEGERLRVIELEQPGGDPQRAVANNNVLQAAVDAGVVAVAAFAAIAWLVARLAWRGRQAEARLLALGALGVLLVNGAFVSNLWDLKVWTVLALALAVERVGGRAQAPAVLASDRGSGPV